MAAAWMARTGIRTLVVERKSRPTDSGHADGLESRTIEILDSFGLGQKIWEESNHTIDICLWVRSVVICRWYGIDVHLNYPDRTNVPTVSCEDKVSQPIQSPDGRVTRSPLWDNLESKPSYSN